MNLLHLFCTGKPTELKQNVEPPKGAALLFHIVRRDGMDMLKTAWIDLKALIIH